MKRLFRHIPPTAVPVKGADLWRGLTASLDQHGALDQFRSALIEQTGCPNCYLVSSGRAALTLVLLGLKRLSKRRRVVIPAYACPTVVQSVLKAGLEPVLCDMSPQTLGLDRSALSRLMDRDVLAVVPVHLYGWAQDIRDIIALGQAQDFYVIEDAAQAFGATLDGRMVGTWGDAGIYSMGSGKCIPVGHGGVIVSRPHCAPAVSKAIQDLGIEASRRNFSSLVLFAGYGLATRPSAWWFVVRSRMNPTDAGMDAKDLPPIKIHGLSATQAGIGLSVLARIDEIQTARRRNAQRLMAQLAEFDFVNVPVIAADADPVFLRLPIVVEGEERANRLFDLLSKEGIGVSRSYWRSLPDLFSGVLSSDEQDFPGATRLARCLLTLPTHAFMKREDFERVSRALQAVDRQDLILEMG